MIPSNKFKYISFLGIVLINILLMNSHLINGNCIMEKKYCITGLNTESKDKCIPWRNSQYKYDKLFENTSLCMSGISSYWCLTGTNQKWAYCQPRKCNLPDIICILNKFWTVHGKKVKLDFQNVSSNFDLIIIITKNPTFSKCSITTKCHHCQSTKDLMNSLFGLCNRENTINPNINSIIIELPEFSSYIIYILPVFEQRLYGSVFKLSITTSLKVPNVPSDINIESITTTSMIIQWKSPEETEIFGSPESYLLNLLSPIQKQYKLNDTKKSLQNLFPCNKYCFNIIAINIAGKSVASENFCRITKPVFDNISSLSSTRQSELSVLIEWNYFNKKNCNVKFLIKYFIKSRENSFRMTETTTNKIDLQDLSKDQYYIVNVTPEIDGEKGQVSNNLEFHTVQVPTTPTNIRMQFRTRNSISIQWNQLENTHSKHLYKYEIKQNGTLKAYADNEQYKLNDLLPCTRYCFTISASNIAGKSEESEPFCASTKAGPTEIEVIQTEVDKSKFKLFRLQHRNMYKCLYEFQIEYLMKPNILQKPSELTKKENLRISLSDFDQIISIKITPFFENEIEEFSLNFNLHSTNKRKTKSIYLIYLFLVLLLLATVSCLVYKKDYFLRKLNRSKKSDIDLKFIDNVDLKISKSVKPKQSVLKSEIETKISKRNFKDLCKNARQYEDLHKLSTNCGELLENKSKNRFANILPYDQTRVILNRSPPKNDYINANYIPFVEDINKHEYIASQGPINDTISDFWQMIWENNVSIIVMLTRTYEEERMKCLQYWPEHIDQKIEYGENNEFQVTMAEEIEKNAFVERKLNLFNEIQNENRVIIQLHMIEWFDYAAPQLKDFESLIFRFQEIVLVEKFDPYLIHCSAGVGRTGTFIVLDRIIRKLIEGIIDVNISEEILEIRKYRKMMVQRVSQFNFIHEFLDYFHETYINNTDKDQDPIYFNV